MGFLLVVDVGNTNMKFGVFAGEELHYQWTLATTRGHSAAELRILLKGLFVSEGLDGGLLEGVVVSSVVPPVLQTLRTVCEEMFGCQPLVVGPDMETGLVFVNDNPRETGTDRIANAVAAVHLYGAPAIVIGMGTATIFDVVDEHRRYLGGAILPGMKISADAMTERTTRLPSVEFVPPAPELAQDTATSMQWGAYYGGIGQVDRVVEQIQAEYQLPFHVVATGGLAELVGPQSRTVQHVRKTLLLEGLRILWELNNKKSDPFNKQKDEPNIMQ